ncbi:MAG TPA: phosphoribosylaminoimidazolesuccinocarboxamide synthase [bacterium]|jgi:phosphoribosylaminoimidazole-succinocarboxamide synthase|nr:phosphoribosylaminoimidazolesuccinocarboxamide synthase [bacterium]
MSTTLSPVVLETNIPGVPAPKRGKVRDIYDLGDKLLIVVTDRISAFDVIMPNGIPDKGVVLNQISHYWFKQVEGIIPNHVISTELSSLPEPFHKAKDQLANRSMIVKKAKPLPAECIVRGYLTGSGLKEYQKTGKVCGIELPKGMVESSRIAQPIFTPSTKAEEGHDINISFEEMKKILKDDVLAQKVKDVSLAIYEKGRDLADAKGIIIADTKFEFGLLDGKLILIDEVMTPDSSRFWPKAEYKEGASQKSFDKQFVRDYLETLKGWDKTPPGPVLPEEIVVKTREKYVEAFERVTGKKFGDFRF